jgi:hypothetical protein
MAAAFAISSVLYSPSVHLNTSTDSSSPIDIANATYSDQLLGHARDLYEFAVNSTLVTLSQR